MHNVHGEHADEHVIQVTDANPAMEQPVSHNMHADHKHGEGDSLHAMVPHGDHMDYLHDGHLHHVHNDHIDEHGKI